MRKLSKKQIEVLEAVIELTRKDNCGPTFGMVVQSTDLAPSTVQDALMRLQVTKHIKQSQLWAAYTPLMTAEGKAVTITMEVAE